MHLCKKRLKFPEGLSECRIHRDGEPETIEQMMKVFVNQVYAPSEEKVDKAV